MLLGMATTSVLEPRPRADAAELTDFPQQNAQERPRSKQH